MLAGAISAMVESLGDYYAAARICGAPVPPPQVISRAVTIQVCPAPCQGAIHHLLEASLTKSFLLGDELTLGKLHGAGLQLCPHRADWLRECNDGVQ
jgi:hypothetical protein